MTARVVGAGLLLVATAAAAHDVGVDVLGNLTTSSQNNPRAGSAGVSLSGSVDLSDQWTGFLMATYLRDLPTQNEAGSTTGSNIFLFSGGAMFVPTEHLMFLATVLGAPPSVQRHATEAPFAMNSADVVIQATNFSVGGSLLGSYSTNGTSPLEHTIDASVGLNYLASEQLAELPNTLRARLYRAYCERNPNQGYCPLVNGAATRLTQVRLGATYTATIATRTDAAVDVAGFLYDTADPLGAGVYSSAIAGRQGPELGQGVPVAPWRLTVRPSVLHRFGPVTVKLGYQFGVYVSDVGTNQLVSLRVTWKVTRNFRLTTSVLAQADLAQGALVNPGGSASLGALVVFP